MPDILEPYMSNSNPTLEHHGILGMRWGHRKQEISSKKKNTKKSYADLARNAKKYKTSVNEVGEYTFNSKDAKDFEVESAKVGMILGAANGVVLSSVMYTAGSLLGGDEVGKILGIGGLAGTALGSIGSAYHVKVLENGKVTSKSK